MSDGFTKEEIDELLAPINKADFERRKDNIIRDIERLLIYDNDTVGSLINLEAIERILNMIKWYGGGKE